MVGHGLGGQVSGDVQVPLCGLPALLPDLQDADRGAHSEDEVVCGAVDQSESRA